MAASLSLSLFLGIHERGIHRMDADYGKETGRSSGSCHLDLHFRYAKNDRAHARYNNFSEPLFTQAIYRGTQAAINKEFTSESRVRVSGRAIYKVSASFRFALVNDYTSFRSCFLSFHGFVLLLHPAPTPLLYAALLLLALFISALSLRRQGSN